MEAGDRFALERQTKVKRFVPLLAWLSLTAWGGVWRDDFGGETLTEGWHGDVEAFRLEEGRLIGVSAHPIALVLKGITVGDRWTHYTATVRVNVVLPNLAICSKGGLVIGKRNDRAFVFVLHTPSRQVEVFEWTTRRILLEAPFPLEYDEWHTLRADVEERSAQLFVDGVKAGKVENLDLAGGVGVAVEDTMKTLFDDFRVSGATIPNGGHGEVTPIFPAGRLAAVWASLKRP